MNKLILIPLLLTSATPAPYRKVFGPPHGEDDDGFHSPWWHPNQNQFPGMGPTRHLGPGFGPFGPQGYGPGHGVKHNGGLFGPPDSEDNMHWYPWGQITTDEPRMTYPIYTTSTTKPGSTGGSAVDTCIAACRGTNDQNPVCGTNDVTYPNIEMLECAKACGVVVDVKRKSRCSRSPFLPPPGPAPTPDSDSGNNNSRDISNNRGDDNPAAVFAYLVCISNCPELTMEYSPVCGTDGVTYSNSGRLKCAQNCGKNVQISRLSSCSAPVNPGPGNAISSCIQTCSETGPNSPVCGNDNVTYYNDGTLECARNCGHNVQISRRTACSVAPDADDLRVPTLPPNGNGNWNGNGGNGNWNGNGGGNSNGGNDMWNGNGNGNGGHGNGNSNGGGNGNGNSNGGGNGNGGDGNGVPSMTELIACVQLCPITLESNPVCGTDGVTYSNPGKLLCAQFCGVNVRAKKFAPCQSDWVPTPQPAVCPTLPTAPLSPEQSCINSCAVSPEFKPVCGTDGLTYINLESLLCKQRCGVDVKLHKQSHCDEVYTNKPTAQTPPVWANTDRTTQSTVVKPTPTSIQTCLNGCNSAEHKPVCGSNGETYANLANLQCAKRCGINVDLNSPCNTSPSIDGSNDAENNLGFTIPPDVLASIFPEEFPVTPPTKVTSTTEADESYEVDQRFEH